MQKITMSLTASVKPSARIVGVFEVLTKHMRGLEPPPPPPPVWQKATPGSRTAKSGVTNM
jgi:hypothetical protein